MTVLDDGEEYRATGRSGASRDQAAHVNLPQVAAIKRVIEDELKCELRVVGRAPGASHDGWVFAPTGDAGHKVLARLEPTEGPFLHYDIAAEAGLLRELGRVGLPVPRVLAEGGPNVAGVGFIALEWIDGEVLNPVEAFRRTATERRRLATELANVLARLHSVPSSGIVALASRPFVTFDAEPNYFSQFDETLSRLEVVDSLAFQYVRVWLQQHAPQRSGEYVMVHGDFRLGNLVWSEGRVAGILDWETARRGDPLFDIGWVCMGAIDGDDLVMGLVPRDEFVSLYGAASGRDVAPADLVFWQVAAAWVRGCTELRLLELGLSSDTPATIDARDLSWMFGSHRTEGELLRLIERHDRLV
jgi:aminoglycoside phosphotransferase (APT) family kinase protein